MKINYTYQVDHDHHHQLRTIGRSSLYFCRRGSITVIISNSGVHAFARQGLRLPDADRDPVGALGGEVVTIDSCLQLVVAGVAMMKQWLDSSDGLKAVLQALKDRKSVALLQPGVC